MSNQLCRCATECEWKPEHYSLPHHPDCPVMKVKYEDTGHKSIERPLIFETTTAQQQIHDICRAEAEALQPIGEAHRGNNERPLIFADYRLENLKTEPIAWAETTSDLRVNPNGSLEKIGGDGWEVGWRFESAAEGRVFAGDEQCPSEPTAQEERSIERILIDLIERDPELIARAVDKSLRRRSDAAQSIKSQIRDR